MTIFSELPERHQDILLRRIGIKNGAPERLEEIAEIYGITRERIRQIEKAAINQLGKSIPDVEEKIDFAVKWQSSGTATAAIRLAGINSGRASYIVRKMIEAGIPLKHFKRGGTGRPKPLTLEERMSCSPKLKARVDRANEFVRMWNSKASCGEIAQKIGMNKMSVASRAAQLKNSGYPIIQRQPTKPTKVSREDFIIAWQKSNSIVEVCNKTGMKHQAVCARRQNLCDRGIPLKSYRKDPRMTPTVIESLKRLALSALGR